MTITPVIRYFLNHLPDLLYRDYLQELLTHPDRLEMTQDDEGKFKVVTAIRPYPGKLVVMDKMFYRVTASTYTDQENVYTLNVSQTGITDPEGVLLSPRTAFMLEPGVIENFRQGAPIRTSVGRVIANYLLLAYPFGNIIPYINDIWKASQIEKIIGDAIIQKTITVEQFNIYSNNLMYIGHSPEFCSPNLTEKALTTDPQLKHRKAELLAEHAAALENHDAVVMSQIESELIAMDKAYLKGDESMNYFLKDKNFSTIRKKLFLTGGMVSAFGDKGFYNFVPNSLEEGWTQESFPIIANDIRAGSYSRAKETADGGVESKFVLRIFQNTRVTQDDCKTQRGLDVMITDDNSKGFVYRNYIDNDGEVKTIAADNHKTFVGRTLKLRSPTYCETPNGGYCYKCMGTLFESLQQDTLATVAVAMSASFTTAALKTMHLARVDVTEVTDLNGFVV